jgi:hypothetical protein
MRVINVISGHDLLAHGFGYKEGVTIAPDSAHFRVTYAKGKRFIQTRHFGQGGDGQAGKAAG